MISMPTRGPVSRPMKDLKDVVCTVIDNGLFVEFARKLAQTFKKVYYYCPWENAFPKMHQARIGFGIPEIEIISSPFSREHETDLFFFPDIYHGPMQVHLAELGYAVWGSRLGEKLETDRVFCKEEMRRMGLPVSPYHVCDGLDALEAYLKENPDQWVKISAFRGNFETFFSESYEDVEPVLNEIRHSMGAFAKITQFIVEPHLDNMTEAGIDTFNIDGVLPKTMMSGFEIKDKAYMAKFVSIDQIPEPVLRYDTVMSPVYRDFGYRGFHSTEVRIGKDQVPFMIDACERLGSPPNELYQQQFANIAELVYAGAHGKVVDPICVKDGSGNDLIYGAELLIHSSWADRNWQPVRFPRELREHVKLRNCCMIDGVYYAIPQSSGLPEIGSVVGYGRTMEAARAQVKEVAAQVKGHYIEIYDEALDSANEAIDKAKEYGVSVF